MKEYLTRLFFPGLVIARLEREAYEKTIEDLEKRIETLERAKPWVPTERWVSYPTITYSPPYTNIYGQITYPSVGTSQTVNTTSPVKWELTNFDGDGEAAVA